MNDDMMFEYLIQMGQMRPEEAELKRRQAQVDALRKGAMTPMEGQMVGKHYVSPGLAGALSQLGQAYFAGQGQKGVDEQLRKMNSKQSTALTNMQAELERRRRQKTGYLPPSTESLMPDDRDIGGGWNPAG